MGASSTRGGMTRGRGGSDMATWIGLPLGILKRVDGDEDIAPLILAMAISKTVPEGARGLA